MAIALKSCQLFSIYNAHKFLNFSWILKHLTFFQGHEFFERCFMAITKEYIFMATYVMLRKCGVPSGAIVNAHRKCINNEIKIK